MGMGPFLCWKKPSGYNSTLEGVDRGVQILFKYLVRERVRRRWPLLDLLRVVLTTHRKQQSFIVDCYIDQLVWGDSFFLMIILACM